ncbi:HR-like lesion-inducer [Dillenia turbinata]|uniref:HR-like lesion-inducer n=1 Tax=Dillenia turbinata TaxID=194707 RepID=A0AAN8Z8H7_9MAGN
MTLLLFADQVLSHHNNGSKGLGGLIFIFGSSLGALLLLLHQVFVTPIMYDFYNYNADKKEFSQLFVKFT